MVTTYNDPATTYDGIGVGYGGFTVSPALSYSVVFRDFTNGSVGSDYSPGAVIAFIDSPTNLAWSEYINEVGEAFFTISQSDAKAAILADLGDLINRRVHMEVLRNGEKVWGGWLGEIDETTNDVVFYGYSYLSGFYDILTDWNQSYTNQSIADLFTTFLGVALDKDRSRVHWFTQGTIEGAVTTSGGSTSLTLPLYRASYKRVLSAFKELVTYAISDTTNHVIFEVTPDGVFNQWSNRKRTVSDVRVAFGHGQVRSFRRIRRPVHRRTGIRSVGASPTSVNLQGFAEDGTLTALMGRSEEPVFFSFVRDADEVTRVTKLRTERANRVDNDLFLSFYRDSIVPFRATGAPYRLGDLIAPEIDHGVTALTGESKVIAGQQVVYTGRRENVRLLLGDRL
jgi:hypothetical protein